MVCKYDRSNWFCLWDGAQGCHGKGSRLQKTDESKLKTREDALAWVIDNQFARRNLTKEEERYYRGLKYNNEKKRRGQPKKEFRQDDGIKIETAQKLAAEHNVSPRTIERDAIYATGITKVKKHAPEIAETLLKGGLPVNYD